MYNNLASSTKVRLKMLLMSNIKALSFCSWHSFFS